jgi:hypothetical protein
MKSDSGLRRPPGQSVNGSGDGRTFRQSASFFTYLYLAAARYTQDLCEEQLAGLRAASYQLGNSIENAEPDAPNSVGAQDRQDLRCHNREIVIQEWPVRSGAVIVDDPDQPDAASALRARAIANPTTPGGIGIGRGEHTQQGRTTASAGGLATTTHPSDSACPLESSMHRCGFLGLRFIHRQKLPTSRNATRNRGSTLHHSIGPGEPEFHPASPSWLRSLLTPPQFHSAGRHNPIEPFAINTRTGTLSRAPTLLSQCDQGDSSQRPP